MKPTGRSRNKLNKRTQPFVRSHSETLPVAAMRVGNEDCLFVGIHSCNTAPTPTGLAEVVSDDIPVFHRLGSYCTVNTSLSQEGSCNGARSGADSGVGMNAGTVFGFR